MTEPRGHIFSDKEAAVIVADKDGHFPYKKDAAEAGDPNPTFGQSGDPASHVESWANHPDEVEAAAACVAAQERLLTVHTEDARRLHELAQQNLAAVRQRLREARTGAFVWGNNQRGTV